MLPWLTITQLSPPQSNNFTDPLLNNETEKLIFIEPTTICVAPMSNFQAIVPVGLPSEIVKKKTLTMKVSTLN